MSEPTNIQIIQQNGQPAFAVIPWTDYERLNAKKNHWWGENTPHEVVTDVMVDGVPSVKAWRLFLGLTQQQVANGAGIKQSALARLEKNNHTPKPSTMQKIAIALGISVEQLEF